MSKLAPSEASSNEAIPESALGDADYLFHLLVAASRYRDTDLETVLKPLGLNVSYYRVMGVLAHLSPCSMTELADFSMVDRTTLTRTVDHLVRWEVVDRCHAKSDRRQVMMSLTELGWARYMMALEVVRSRNERLLAKMPAHLQRALIKSQQALIASWDLGEELTHRLLTLRRGDGKTDPSAAND